MDKNRRISLALLLLRVSVFIVMCAWTVDKFARPEHAAAVYENFYFFSGLSTALSYFVGFVEFLIIVGFLTGYKKTLTYGIVLILHGISTISSLNQYVSPFQGTNLLFFAAWPMLAACFALYLLRDMDTLLTLDKK